MSELKQGQKKASRPVKKRGMKKAALATEADPKQPKLVNFGIVRYKEKRAERRGAKIDVSILGCKNCPIRIIIEEITEIHRYLC